MLIHQTPQGGMWLTSLHKDWIPNENTGVTLPSTHESI